MACVCKICGRVKGGDLDTSGWTNWDCGQCFMDDLTGTDGTASPEERRGIRKRAIHETGEAIMAGKARLLITMMLMLCAVGRAATLYVDVAGGGDGSSTGSPLALSAVMAAPVTGNTYLLKGEVYNDDVSIAKDASAGGTITFQADPTWGTGVPIFTSDAARSLYLVNCKNLAFVGITFKPLAGDDAIYILDTAATNEDLTFTDCIIDGSNGPAFAIRIEQDADDIVFNNLTVDNDDYSSGVALYLQGNNTVCDVTMNNCTISGSAAAVNNQRINIDGVTNLIITGGTYSGHNTGANGKGFIENASTDSSSLTITNATFDGWTGSAPLAGAVMFNGSGNLSIDGCTFTDTNSGCGIIVKNCTGNVTVTNSTFGDATADSIGEAAIAIAAAADITITGNTIQNCAGKGVYINDHDIANGGITDTVDITGKINISSNVIHTVGNRCIIVADVVTSFINVVGNVCYGAVSHTVNIEGGITNEGTNYPNIVGNVVGTSGDYPLVVKNLNGGLVADNYIYGATDHPLFLKGVNGTIVRNNTIDATGMTHGIHLNTGTEFTPNRESINCTIQNNAIFGFTTDGIDALANQTYVNDYNCYDGNTETNGVDGVPTIDTDGRVVSINCKNTGTPILTKSDGTVILRSDIGATKFQRGTPTDDGGSTYYPNKPDDGMSNYYN